jgi:hypothetical protein
MASPSRCGWRVENQRHPRLHRVVDTDLDRIEPGNSTLGPMLSLNTYAAAAEQCTKSQSTDLDFHGSLSRVLAQVEPVDFELRCSPAVGTTLAAIQSGQLRPSVGVAKSLHQIALAGK